MKPKSRFLRSSLLPANIAMSLGLAIAGLAPFVTASTLTWDASGTATTAPTDGAGTWNTSAVNWNNGAADAAWPNTSADLAVFGAANGAAGTVTVGTVTANGITFNAAGSGNYLLSAGTLTLAGSTPTITANTNATISAVLDGTVGLKFAGGSTLTLTGANLYTGTTSINAGILDLGGGTANGSINPAGTLAFGGGTLSYTRTGGTTQAFASTAVNAGASAISVVAGDTLALGAITQSVGGTVDFSTTGTTTTTTANTNDILGGWATTNNSGVANLNGDWAANDGSGNIITYTGYTLLGGNQAGAGASAQNWKNTAAGTLLTLTSSATINSLMMQGDVSINSGATMTLGSGGLMMHGIARWLLNNGAGNISGTGVLKSGLATGELYVHVPDSTATNWTIWPVIADGSVASQLIKDGPGYVQQLNSNTYSGGTTINGGTLGIGNTAATNGAGLGTGSVTINRNGTLRVGATITSNTNVATIANNTTLAGGSIFEEDAFQHLTGTLNVTAASTLGSTFNGGAGDTNKGLFIDGIVSGSGNLTLKHSGINTGNAWDTSMVYFTNASNTYSGTITVSPMSGTAGGSYLGVNSATALSGAAIVLPGNNTSSAQQFGTSPVVFNTGLGSATFASLTGSANLVLTGYNESTHAYSTGGIALTIGGNNANMTLSGPISGLGSLTKAGTGTLVLSGANTYAGDTTVKGGKVLITGSSSASGMVVGNTSGVGAALYQTGNITTSTRGVRIGQLAGAFGYYKLSSGALTLLAGGEVDPGGDTGGASTFGQFDMVGGTVSGGDYLLPNRGAAGEASVTNITAGTFTIGSNLTDGSFNGLAVNWQNTGAAQTATITINGSGQFLSPTVRVKLNEGSSFNGTSGNSANVASLNLGSGGLLQTLGFLNGAANNGNVSINFNGGTLKAGNAANAGYLANLGSVNVYSGGATIDNNSQAIGIAQPFVAVSGTGVSSVPVTAEGSGYVTPPKITFTGGTVTGGSGSAATGYATIDSVTGAVTGIVITNPGTYSSTSGLTVTLTGGGSGSGATLGAISINAGNTSGGMAFNGAGSTTLSGTNTYTGATTVNGGTLTLGGTAAINASSGITIGSTSSGKFVQTSLVASTPPITLTQGTLDGTGTVGNVTVAGSASNTLTAGNGGTGTLTTGSLTFNGAATANLALNNSTVTKSIAASSLATGAGTVTVNVTNAGIWTLGNYPLITYTGTIGGSGFGSFALGTVPGLGGRQNASLTDTGSAVALTIAGDTPVWTGLASGAWTTTAIGGSQNWKLLIGGGGTEFLSNDIVVFDDSAAGTTSVTINDATVNPTSTTFNNSSKNYTLSGSNGITSGSLTKNGSGSLTLGNPNTYGGTTTLNAGTLNLNHASAIGTGTFTITGGAIDNTSGVANTLTTNNAQNWNTDILFGGSNDLNLGTGAVTLGASRTVTTNGSATLTAGGVLSGTGFALTKAGTGTLTLGGMNAYTGNTTVNAGTLNLTGSSAMVGGLFVNGGGTLSLSGTFGTNTNNNTFIVGQAAGKGTLNVLPGVSLTRANLFVGDSGTGAGAVYQSGGAITLTQAAGVDNLRIGSSASGTGYYNLSGGSLTSNEMDVGGSLADTVGVMDISGGTAIDNGWFVIGRGSATSSGVLNVSGGSLTFGTTAANPLALNWGGTSGATTVVNVGGGINPATITGPSTATAAKGLSLSFNNIAGTAGIVNLLANGTLTVNGVEANNANPLSLLNFNGGTLMATATNRGANYLTSGNAGVYVYGGGGTIHNNGTNITIATALQAPTAGSGNGVNGIASFTGGAGYIGDPMVKVVNDPGDTTGRGATAVAQVNPATGQVTSITITNPGVGYTATPTFVLTGGGATTAATVTGTAPAPNGSGGMTFTGSGVTTLGGTNTYTGGTTVNGGVLQITGDTQLGAVPGSPTVNITLNGGVLYNNNSTPILDVNRTILLGSGGGYIQAGWAAQGQGMIVNGQITGTTGLNINWDGGYTLLNAVNGYHGNTTIGVTGPGYWANAAANPIVKLGVDDALPFGASYGNVVFGISALSNTATLDLNGHNAQVNGLSGSANAFIDNTGGVGVYVLTVGNNNQTSTFAGAIKNTDGYVTLSKTGSGTLTLSGTNTYTGGTAVLDGAVVLHTGGSLSAGSALTLGNNTTSGLFQLGDGSGSADATVSGLTVSGTGTTNAVVGGNASVSTLTVNNAASSSYAGVLGGALANQDNLALVKSGAGELTLSGANTYTGATTVTEGTLAVSGSLGATAVLVQNNGTLAGTGSLGGSVTVNSGGHLAYAVAATSGAQVTQSITGSLTLDSGSLVDLTAAATPAAGTYTLATASGGIAGTPVIGITLSGVSATISVSGNNIVLTVASSGYSSWAASKGLDGSNNGLLQDPDNDGITNLVEYVLDGDPLASTQSILPTQDSSGPNLVFTFYRRHESADDTTQVFQYGSDLSNWTDVAIPATSAGIVTITPDTPTSGIDQVVVTLAKGAETKLFGRLHVTKP